MPILCKPYTCFTICFKKKTVKERETVEGEGGGEGGEGAWKGSGRRGTVKEKNSHLVSY